VVALLKIFFKNLLFLFIILILLAISAFYVFKNYSKVYPGEISFFEGASARDVADILEVNNNIKNADVFYYYLRGKEFFYDINPLSERTFKPSFKNGTFDLKSGDFEYLIGFISDFKNDKKQKIPVEERYTVIPEGYTVEQTADILEKRNIVNKEVFLDLVNDINYYETLRKKYFWLPEYNVKKKFLLEGFLHPNSYEFEKSSLPHLIIETMLDQTNVFYEDNKISIVENKYSFDQILTLASIVERESKFKEDRPKVAQVFLNRLDIGMKIQSDITVLYSLNQHKTFVTFKDLEVDSLYNTYKYPGLPVGPINTPSLESINAVLNPAGDNFNFVYFYARPSGETFYSENLKEHDEIRKKYEQEWLDLN
jgi:UPF0755 protein